MALIFEQAHIELMLKDLYSQFDDAENLKDLIRGLGEAVQVFEDTAYDYTLSQLLDLAEGYLLDRIGHFVGAQRLGATDNQFRKIIRARVAAQRSNSTIGEIGHVLDLLVDAKILVYSTAHPAGYRFYFVANEGTLADDQIRRILRVLELARPAGVAASYVEAAGSDADTFKFDVDPGFGRKFSRILE